MKGQEWIKSFFMLILIMIIIAFILLYVSNTLTPDTAAALGLLVMVKK